MTGRSVQPDHTNGGQGVNGVFRPHRASFDISALCASAGAPFVARTTVYHVNQMDRLLVQAINKHGFSVVEVLSPCYTNFGRQNRMGSHLEMMKQFKQFGVPVDRWEKMSESERSGRFPIGVLGGPGIADLFRFVSKRVRDGCEIACGGQDMRHKGHAPLPFRV